MAKRGPVVLLLVCCLAPTSCGRRVLNPEELERTRLFAEIIKREDRRVLGEDEFFPQNLRSAPYPIVREWCAIALGRIGNPRALRWLYESFRSPYAGVRAAAAFAVGEIEDREILKEEFRRVDARAAAELVDLLDDPSIQVRMRAVEALGKVGSVSDATEIVRRLQSFHHDGSPEQRAYLGFAITALMRLKEPDALPVLEKLAGEPDPEIQWRVSNALYRLRARNAKATFLRLLQSPHPDVRAHAARGLSICEDPNLAEFLHPLLLSHDPQSAQSQPLSVRVCAVQALGNLKSPKSVSAIQTALNSEPINRENPDQMNFAVQAATALGNIGAGEAEFVLVPLLKSSGPVADSAIVALAKLLKGNERFYHLTDISQVNSEAGTRALAEALGELGGQRAIRGLKDLLIQAAGEKATSAQVLTIPTVLQSLEKTRTPDLDVILGPYLASQDGVILRAAIGVYKPKPAMKEPWKPLIEAYQRMAPGNNIEAKVAALNALDPWIRQEQVQSTLRSALADRQRNARIAASRLLRKAGADDVDPDPGPSESATTEATYGIVASNRVNRTVAVLETERGKIEIELYRQDAPLTVANFVTLARGGFFDGLSFMRVVPYFVIQGGDPRNDMEGGPGYTIRCEINTRPYERGSVGMALAGKDTGGSQFFITLSPQPHLDGGYTCFGRVISGLTAAERMTAGDRIVKVRIVEDATLLNFQHY